MAEKILLVDDEESIIDVSTRYLQRDGYEVITAANGEEAIVKWRNEKPDLIVLDLMMPLKDGIETAEEIRAVDDVPIIMLTALGQERDRLLGLTVGADDYLTKPFSPRELVLRVRNILRRTKKVESDKSPSIITYGDLVIDESRRKVMLSGNEIELTVKEFDILFLLASHPTLVFPRSQLIEAIWGYEFDGDGNTVNVHIRRLREKIEKDSAEPKWIKTVWGIGYKFEGQST
ncbi:response regulator transcription factor [Alkalihalobacillus macyae]|uniref:response regulator transcription factor n=1 Tax=Guptibacillus hwajinpoensis TaxID=208199 RepID=UPI00273CA7FD|nr:response regulator transcription factor [Alkalihalobacillus macyae]MDP4551953.1 response regulator transcription factor [Alkalihalobacillus macyae]